MYLQSLPEWIYRDPEYLSLSPGERWALHAIAGAADNPRDYPGASGHLLGAFTGTRLIKEAVGCSPSTFWKWLGNFERLGFVVVLSRGGGKLADVLGIPAARGELDALAAPKKRRARRRYSREEMHARLAGLVSGNRTVALVSEDRTAPIRESDSSTHPGIGRHLSEDRTVPSPTHTLNEPVTIHAYPMDGCARLDSVEAVAAALIEAQVVERVARDLSEKHPELTVPVVEQLAGEAITAKNPPGAIVARIREGRIPEDSRYVTLRVIQMLREKARGNSGDSGASGPAQVSTDRPAPSDALAGPSRLGNGHPSGAGQAGAQVGERSNGGQT